MAKEPTFDPRELMEQAVKVMKASVAEARADGKASPLVGAVLWMPDGTVETACRGELRDGDHAEYTLLERKNRDKKLDGAVLFATLEPCAPGARREPKKSCAERIVWARIKKVWVGIEDPDPLVDRKGIEFLKANGVAVAMFDRDLQEVIREANRDFIVDAVERAALAEQNKQPESIALSSLENRLAGAEMGDLSAEVLERYRSSAKVKEDVGSFEFNRRLALQGLLLHHDNRWTPTGFGVVLFGEEPRIAMPQAGLLGTIQFPDGREETKDFDGPQLLVPEDVLEWLRNKLPNPSDRSEALRQEANKVFYELVREGIVNALVHRDYDIKQAKCQLVVTQNAVTIKSPGALLNPITLEQMQAFDAPMLSRNPVLHYAFSKMGFAEERGLGLRSMRERAQQAGLPLPRYLWEAPYLVLTIYWSQDGVTNMLDISVRKELNTEELEGWKRITSRGAITAAEYAKQMGFNPRKAQRHLKHFCDLLLLTQVGKGRATMYMVIPK